MFTSTLLAMLPLLAPLIRAAPTADPSINVIFFSDNNCTTTVPPTIYTRSVSASTPCEVFPDQLYQSLLIDSIDDQFIGTNSALQVGSTGGDTCDFTFALKYSIATRETVGQCQFVGIPAGMHQPLRSGNEYRLTTLQG